MSDAHATQSQEPLVTIYIPTRDRAELVMRAVRSALAQEGVSVEVIVVDDGSTDDTLQRLHAMAALDSRLKVLQQQPSQGACAARNRAIAEARGRFCAGLDDDDELTPDHVAKLLAHYDERYSLVAPSLIEVHADKRVANVHEAGVVTLDRLLHYNCLGPQVLVLTERLRAMGGFDTSLEALQDYDLWVRLVARYGPALRIRHPSYVQHMAHGHVRISHSQERRLRALARFAEKHAALMSKAHKKSMELHVRKYRGETLHLRDALRLWSKGNSKMVVSMLINSHVPGVQRLYHRVVGVVSQRQDF